MQMQKKLKCYQGDNKTITEYVYELQELFNMIRAIPDRNKVIQFWYGIKPIIQKGLWRDNLNPDMSTWEEVVSRAEIIEIMENITNQRDRGLVNTTSQGTTFPHSGNYRHRQTRQQNRSLWLMTLENTSLRNNARII